jgi:uncharacterized integral membrane protein
MHGNGAWYQAPFFYGAAAQCAHDRHKGSVRYSGGCMHVRTIIISITILAIAALAALNWAALSAPASVSLGVASIEAPLGLIMLGLTALLGAVFLAYVFYLHSSVMLEARRHNKEMAAQRELADKAEASRFTELRIFLEAQQQQEMAAQKESAAALAARLDQLEKALEARAEQSDNGVAAQIGELEDRLERRQLLA